jgi:hypothetical protein
MSTRQFVLGSIVTIDVTRFDSVSETTSTMFDVAEIRKGVRFRYWPLRFWTVDRR